MYVHHTHMPIWLRRAIAATAVPSFFVLVACGGDPPANNIPTPAHGSATGAAQAKPALTVELVAAKEVAWAQSVPAAGDVAPWQESLIGFELGGQRIVKVLAQVGDIVRKGQPLVELDTQILRVELDAAKALVTEAKAQESQALSTLERSRRLERAGGVSEQELAQQKTSWLMAQAKVATAQAQVNALQLKISRSILVAPDDGVILTRMAAHGAIAQAGAEMFRLMRQSRLEWRAEVSSSSLHLIEPGQVAKIKTSQGDTIFGKVRQIAPSVNITDRTGVVYVDLPNNSSIKSGMHLSGELLGPSKLAVTVPMSAVSLRDGKSYVFSAPSGVAKSLVIQVGRANTTEVEVLSGLPANTQVIKQGAGFLKDGDLVRVLKAEKDVQR